MTEDEAKTKWCPLYRVTNASGYTLDNRAPNDPTVSHEMAAFPRYRCIGSACMAWRTTVVPTDSGNDVFNIQNKIIGYCGLVGAP